MSIDKEAFYIQEVLFHKYMIEVPIKCINGNLYVRLSVHVYNSIEQYEQLADVIQHWRYWIFFDDIN